MSVDINKLLERISWGKLFINFGKRDFILRSLTIKEQNHIDFIYKKALDEAASLELLFEHELAKIYYKAGDWSREKEQAIAKARKEIQEVESQKAGLKLTAANKLIISKADRKIRKIEKLLNDLLSKRNELFQHSAESYADQMSKSYQAFYILQNTDGGQYWPTIDNFEHETNLNFIYEIIYSYYNKCFLDEKTIREVARNGNWRFQWAMCKNDPVSLFGSKMYNLTYDQKNLIYWSQVYDMVYESMDRPPDTIINDDKKLDNWLKQQSKKARREATEKHHGLDKQQIKPGKVGTQELFLMAKDNDEAKDIQELNSDYENLKRQKERERMAKSNRPLTELELRKRDLMLQARAQRKGK